MFDSHTLWILDPIACCSVWIDVTMFVAMLAIAGRVSAFSTVKLYNIQVQRARSCDLPFQ